MRSISQGVPNIKVAVLAGFVMLTSYAGLANALDSGWPREIGYEKGTITIYQPQVEALTGQTLDARGAVMIKVGGQDEPVFGAVWFRSRVNTDRDARTVELLETHVERVRFPNITSEQEAGFRRLVDAEIPRWNLELSLDRLLTDLELNQQEQTAAEDLNMDPPSIIYVTHPAVLVMIDGEPVLRAIEDTKLMRVVNSPYLMVFDSAAKSYYLNAGVVWYAAAEVKGPWQVTKSVPAEAAALVPKEALVESGLDSSAPERGMPQVIVATEPTELVSTEGAPSYKPFPGNELLYVSNTESDILMEIGSQQHYILLAGRWFRTGSLQNGPWTYVRPDELPTSFQSIPAGSEKAHLRASVTGTEEAGDAVMDAQIPQTAAVKRSEAQLEVQYDGKPVFKEVEGTSMTYATNTNSSILKIGNLYYSCDQGVWFKSGSPEGPWELADSVPQEVQKIPPSNPTYNVKYVYVYDSTPDVVYVGYTPGYTSCYHYHGTVVYGTGWHYRPWIGPYHYYPHHMTFGFAVRYNPWTGGWGFGFSTGYGGFRFSFAWGSGWHGGPWWGPRPGWWGPGGYRAGYYHGYRAGYWAGRNSGRRPTTMPARINVVNPKIHVGDKNVNIGNRISTMDRDNLYRRPENQDRLATRDRPQTMDGPQRAEARDNRQNNVFVDKDGNVFRRNGSTWEQKDRSGWQKSDLPGAATRDARPSTRESRPGASAGTRPSYPSGGTSPGQPSVSTRPATPARPSAGTRPSPSARPSTGGNGSLNRDYSSRQRGSARTQNYNRSRSSTRTAPRRRR